MIEAFLNSWSLFQNAWLAGFLIAVLLSLVGVLVVARDQIFLGAAVSQASTLGIALGMGLGSVIAHEHPWLESDAFLSTLSVAFALLAALLASRAGGLGRESYEAVTGFVFLISASLSVLVIFHSPHGLEEIHRLVSSSIIGASRLDVAVFAVLTLFTLVVIIPRRRRLVLFAMDPAMARAVGVLPGFGMILSVWLGLTTGLAIRSAGVLYAFGCLVLPALVAKNICREAVPMVFASPVIALVASLIGFVIANDRDYPPAQLTVAILCAALTGAWIFRAIRTR